MFFKKKEKKITWKKNGEYFSVYINDKLIEEDIPSCWLGDDLLVLIEKLQRYYFLKDYVNLQDDIICEAEYAAEADIILWSKLGEGYYLYENGETVNDESTSIRIEEIMLVSYKNSAYLLRNYDSSDDNILQEAILICGSDQVYWIKAEDNFYVLNGGELLDIKYSGNYCKDDLLVYLEQDEALFLLNDYANAEDYMSYEATRIAEKDEFIWRKVGNGSFNIFRNHETYHSDAKATYHSDDAIVYVPELNSSFFLGDLRNDDGEDYYGLQTLPSNVYWSGQNKTFSLIVNGENIADRIGKHNSWVGNDLLIYDPETSTTYLFQDFDTLQDNKLREAVIVSRSAKTVWKAYNNQFWIWHEGMKTGKCEHQMMGNDLMAMPANLKIMFQLQNFRNSQDNRLRAIE